MNAKLYYRYSKLDKEKQFALVCDNVWIWYYLGMNTGCIKQKFGLYPYLPSPTPVGEFKLVKEYNYIGAHEIADWISKRIWRKLKK